MHSSGTLRKDCNIVNSTICLTATLIGIHVVVGDWKSHVFANQNTKAAIQWLAVGRVTYPRSRYVYCHKTS